MLEHFTAGAVGGTQTTFLLLLVVIGTIFCGYERNLEKPGKNMRGVIFPIHLHRLLILKSKSDNLITSVNDFSANNFHQNIQSFACLTVSNCFILLYILFLPKSLQLSKTSSSPIFHNPQPTWVRRYRLKYFQFATSINSLEWLWWLLHSLIFSLPHQSIAEAWSPMMGCRELWICGSSQSSMLSAFCHLIDKAFRNSF